MFPNKQAVKTNRNPPKQAKLTRIPFSDDVIAVRYGRRSKTRMILGERQEVESDLGVLPLLDRDDDSAHLRRTRNRRGLRLASRCQVTRCFL